MTDNTHTQTRTHSHREKVIRRKTKVRTQKIKMEQDENGQRQKIWIRIYRKGQNVERLGNEYMRLQCRWKAYTRHITNERPPCTFLDRCWLPLIFLTICTLLLSCAYNIIILCCLSCDGYFHSSCNYVFTGYTKAHVISSLLM